VGRGASASSCQPQGSVASLPGSSQHTAMPGAETSSQQDGGTLPFSAEFCKISPSVNILEVICGLNCDYYYCWHLTVASTGKVTPRDPIGPSLHQLCPARCRVLHLHHCVWGRGLCEGQGSLGRAGGPHEGLGNPMKGWRTTAPIGGMTLGAHPYFIFHVQSASQEGWMTS